MHAESSVERCQVPAAAAWNADAHTVEAVFGLPCA